MILKTGGNSDPSETRLQLSPEQTKRIGRDINLMTKKILLLIFGKVSRVGLAGVVEDPQHNFLVRAEWCLVQVDFLLQ